MVVTVGPRPGGIKGSGGRKIKGRGEGRRIYGDIEGNRKGNQIHGIQFRNLNTIKGQSVVFLWPMLWYWNSTTQLLARRGNMDTGQKEKKEISILKPSQETMQYQSLIRYKNLTQGAILNITIPPY